MTKRNVGLKHGQNDPAYAGTMAEGRFLLLETMGDGKEVVRGPPM